MEDSHPQLPANDRAWLCDQDEVARRLPYPEALARTLEVADRCQVEILAGGVIPPTARLSQGSSALARAGAFQSRLSRREALWRIGLWPAKAGPLEELLEGPVFEPG